jgi:hypothetical protein
MVTLRKPAGLVSLASLTVLLLGACNAVLGIEDPIEVLPGASGSGGKMQPVGTGGGAGAPPRDAQAPTNPADFVWAEWPMPNPASAGLPNPQSYDTLSFNGVVIDLITGLQWQQVVGADSYVWSDGVAYCSHLMLAGGGWRLPSRIELLSLVDYTSPNPIIDMTAFPETPPEYFWTSSLVAGNPANAWDVNFQFSDGMTDTSETNKPHRVRCVR